jgi:peptidoglycan hydrolase-like protein with peptidoglycan-binding domain
VRDQAVGNGVIARAVDRAFENPAMSGGLLVMALTATAIVSNAMFLQTGHHPEPLFTTRPSLSPPTPKLAPVVPAPRNTAKTVEAAPPPLSPAPPAAEPGAEPEAVLVAKIQRELARLGLYVGSIDGIAGSRTKSAIAAYETAAGRAVTGMPTAELLEFMTNAPLTPAQSAAAPPPTTGVAADNATQKSQPDAASPSELYRRVQTALNQAGYGPIAVDGHPGSASADAIRRFELDNGLPITGDIGDQVIARLVAIGAMDAE